MRKRRRSTSNRRLNRRRSHSKSSLERLEERILLAQGPQLIAVQPNVGNVLRDGVVRHVAPRELTFVFNEQQTIDPTTLDGIRITRAGFDDTFDGVTDVMIQPGFIGPDPVSPNEIIVRFAHSLPDDLYRLEVFAIDNPDAGIAALRNVDGDAFVPAAMGVDRTTISFELDLGAQVVAVVPQPIRRDTDGGLEQARNQIEVYFNDDDLDSAEAVNPAYYTLIYTAGTVENTDDVAHRPTIVEYDAQLDRSTLTFGSNIEALSSSGVYRLRIGADYDSDVVVPVTSDVASDPGSSFTTAMDIGELTQQSRIFREQIRNEQDYPLEFPGAGDEPGHRQIDAVESHVVLPPDETPNISRIEYNFRTQYGWDPRGRPLFNLITEEQKERTREIFELFSQYAGVDVVETDDAGIAVVTGDLRAINRFASTGPGGTLSLSGDANPDPDIEWPTAVMDNAELWDDAFGITRDPGRFSWFDTAMRETGHLLGLGDTFDLPGLTVTGDDAELNFSNTPQETTSRLAAFDHCSVDTFSSFLLCPEGTFPGAHDVVHLQHLYRPESNDIDLYRFEITEPGSLTAETIAERRNDSSLLDSVISIYREQNGRRQLIARNDDYFSEDSFLRLSLEPGTYYAAVSSTGNTQFDPAIENTGLGGTSEGPYDLRLDFRPQSNNLLRDATGTQFDGDADGVPGGIYNFWVQAADPSETVYVDKSAADGGDGSLDQPYNNLATAIANVSAGQVLRIVGNGGADADLATLNDNLAYELGSSNQGHLADGLDLRVPRGVTVIVDAGAVFKLHNSNLHVGSSSVTIDRSQGALQVLGTPEHRVVFTSYDDQSIGVDTNPRVTQPAPGDWGGIVFENDVDRAEGRFDYEQEGIFLNYVGQADLRYGGGNVQIDSRQQVTTPIHLIDARPTISYNSIRFSADAGVSANPNSFEETNYSVSDSLAIDFQEVPFTPDYARIGPDLRGNRLSNNSINGLFVRISTPAGDRLQKMTVTGRFDDTDMVHVVAENLVIAGNPGGPVLNAVDNTLTARRDAQLRVDPGVVVKLDGSRIEAEIGAQLLAEGSRELNVVFTSIDDDRFGAGGTFDTSQTVNQIDAPPGPGDWGGIYVGPRANGSLDHAVVAYGGGLTRVAGSFARFNSLEVNQGHLRLTRSVIEQSANGRGGQAEPNREGHGINDQGAIFIRGAQPVIIDNIIRGTQGFTTGVVNVDVNSLNASRVVDPGRMTGMSDAFAGYADNQGPLIRLNRLQDNSLNGMVVRGGTLVTESVWDDTDIVHIVLDEIAIPDFHTFGGLRLESSPNESLVVKFEGQFAGFKATGRPLEIDDRIGGMLHVVGQPGRPVVLTALSDDTVGAGFDPSGQPQTDTDGLRRDPADQPPGSFQIDLVFGPLARSRPEVMAAVEDAARIWEGLLEDPITITIDIELDPNLGNGILGLTTSEFAFVDYDTVRDLMIADGGTHEQNTLTRLPQFRDLNVSLPRDPVDPFSLSTEMSLTSANAKAIGVDPAFLPAVPSTFDATKNRDAAIDFHINPYAFDSSDTPFVFDYDRSDGIIPDTIDFVGVAIHEIGHALGFISAVDDVDAALDSGGGNRLINMSSLDMFRLEPGEGAVDFTGAPRNLDPRLEHVFNDGGQYDPFGLPVPGLRLGDIPLSQGGTIDNCEELICSSDGEQASHWKPVPNYIGMMGPGAQVSFEDHITTEDRIAFDLMGWDVVGDPVAGDWRGITLEQFSHDRNVQVITELEDPRAPAPGSNGIPGTAQFLGGLGRGEHQSDENLRLGFQIHGLINEPTDVDVYSFVATAGTQVWFDIDHSAQRLDSVVELIDANGLTLARSDNSYDEGIGRAEVFAAPGVDAYPLRFTPFQRIDNWSTNIHDAGMRVVLPGRSGQVNTYHLRVRSSSPDLAHPRDGLTFGGYELDVRLGEVDEHPGSTVQFTNISYAVDGIRVRGLPTHSPLGAEVAEQQWERFGTLLDRNDELPVATALFRDPQVTSRPGNSRALVRPVLVEGRELQPYDGQSGGLQIPEFSSDSFQEPQFVGNLLNTDRGAISIAGRMDSAFRATTATDAVDWYMFAVNYDAVRGGRTVDVVFDLDYADGLARADLALNVYQALPATTSYVASHGSEWSAGNLIFSSESTAQSSDLPAPFQGSNVNDLTRGSVSTGDPYLGPIALSQGYYFLQVINKSVIPIEELQYTEKLPPNPLYRKEPINSIFRIAEDRIAEPITDDGQGTTFTPPQVPLLLNPSSAPVPFHLGDVELFVSTGSVLSTVNPFTGRREAVYGTYTGLGGEVPVVGDFALRDNPLYDPASADPNVARGQRLHAFNVLPLNPFDNATDATIGNYLHLDPIDEQLGVGFVPVKGVGEGGAFTDDGVLTFDLIPPDPDDPDAEFTLGPLDGGVQYDAIAFDANTLDVGVGYAIGSRDGEFPVSNILVQFVAATGEVFGDEQPDEERIPYAAPAPDPPPDPAPMRIPNGGLNFIEQGVLDTTAQGGPGGEITGITFIGSRMYGVSDEGGLYQITGYTSPGGARARYLATIFEPDDGDPATDPEPISFSGLATGPGNVEGGVYGSLLFGVDSGGNLYAFDTAGVLQPVFVDGSLSVETGVRGAVGLDFATVDENMWHVTTTRGADPGHGRLFPFPQPGNTSFYFGEDLNAGGGQPRFYDFLGGAAGSLVTDPFSLDGYSELHEPFVYFNYFLSTEESTDFGGPARDSFRVFITDDSDDNLRGQWHLLASNQILETGIGGEDVDPRDDILIDVQPLWDNSFQDVPFVPTDDPGPFVPNGIRDAFPFLDDSRPFDPGELEWPQLLLHPSGLPLDETQTVWRQARVSIRDFVGSDSLRLRFDFSTAGSFDMGGSRSTGGTELRAIAGARLEDGATFVIDGQTFEFDSGYTVVLPPSTRIEDGETLTIDGFTIEFDRDNNPSAGADGVIRITNEEVGAEDVAAALATVITQIVDLNVTPHIDSFRVNLEGATNVSQSALASIALAGAPGVADGSFAVIVNAGMSADDVAEAMIQPLADAFAEGNTMVIKSDRSKVQIIGHNVDDPGPLGMSDRLPGDRNGAFSTNQRTQLNRERLYDPLPDDDEDDFVLPFEGVFVDDLIVGFAAYGEASTNLRPDYLHEPFQEDIPDVYAHQKGQVQNVLAPPGTILVGEYQLEIRRASEFSAGVPFRTFDPRDSFAQTITLVVPSGAGVYDGQTFTLSDGLRSATFEYDDQQIGNGVAEGNWAIPFNVADSAPAMVGRIRDAVNALRLNNQLALSATAENLTSGGDPGTGNRLDLIGNAIVVDGIDFLLFDEKGGENQFRDQGQILISSNDIRHSAMYGIVVEDSWRDFPCKSGEGATNPTCGIGSVVSFDLADTIDHAQATAGDYVPHGGAVRNLRELNQDELLPGITIANNIIAFGREGGIHYGGDPGGHVIISPIGGDNGEVFPDGDLHYIFTVTDNNGDTEWFEFEGPGQTALAFIDNPIQWADHVECDRDIHPLAGGCSARFSLAAGARDMTDALIEAFARSNLDVEVYRTRGDEVFVEGAADIQSIIVRGTVDGVSFSGDQWFYPFNIVAPPSSRSFGRIVNNTIVGLGGRLEGDNAYNADDFNDVGILVEDNAEPTLLNNVVVNFKAGIAVDDSASNTIVGGTVFKGNLDNSRNTGPGDFVLEVSDDTRLFVDFPRANFYPSEQAPIIDSSVDSLEDRPELVTVKEPLGIARSPILAPAFDVLGQLRIDDPRVEPPEGSGQNVFKDRGAVDRVDFTGPTARLETPADNDTDGLDTNPQPDRVRVGEGVALTEFVIQLVDVGEAGALTGAGIVDSRINQDSVILRRDGERLLPGVDYRFDYQTTTDTILLTPQAGVWLNGFSYEIELINTDRHVITPTRDSFVDGLVFNIVDQRGGVARFEVESGYTLEIPEPLSLFVPAGSSGLSAVSDSEIFTISNGSRLVTFEFDSDGIIASGRIRVPFGASSTPQQVADAIVTAINSAELGLAPENLGDGLIHVGGPSNTLIDTSLSPLEQRGAAGGILDGHTFTILGFDESHTFEFDQDGTPNLNTVPFTVNDTRATLAAAVTAAIAESGAPVEPVDLANGQIHLGGTQEVQVRPDNSNLLVLGQPGFQSTGTGQLVPIEYQPRPDTSARDIASLIGSAVAAGPLSDVSSFVNESDEVDIVGANVVQGIENRFIEGIQDVAGNDLQTNQNEPPFETLFVVDLPAPLDFGDTPDPPYVTTLGQNGARHVIVPNVFLGSGVDNEPDAHVSSDASGDSQDDGVAFGGPIAPGGVVPVTIIASTSGFIDAWIDFDQNGVYESKDQLFRRTAVNRGSNTLMASVPVDTQIGTTFARFRFSTAGGLAAVGRAENGEVEDYQVTVEDIAPPLAVDDEYDVDEDTQLDISASSGVLANDEDPQGGSLTTILLTPPSNGTLDLRTDGTFVYEPSPDFFGVDRFQYRAATSILQSGPATVTIRVNPVPDPPMAFDDSSTTKEDTEVLINLIANDTDSDGALNPSSIEIVVEPTNGTVNVNQDGTVIYTPARDYVGSDQFQYTIQDAEQAVSNAATVTIEVERVNDRPSAVDDRFTTARDMPRTIDLIGNDLDPDGEIDPQSIVITVIPKSGFVDVHSDGTLTFTPAVGFLGTDSFRYNVRDNEGALSNEAIVTVIVTDDNESPVAVDDQVTTVRDEEIRINVVANDFDPDGAIVPGSVQVMQSPDNGSAVANLDGTVTYTPNPGFVGRDMFRYNLRDDLNAMSNMAMVTIDITAPGPPWQNPDNPADVDGNGIVVPLDVLLVINEVNSRGSRPLGTPPLDDPPFSPPPYYDVSGDNFLAPLDALLVINVLNTPPSAVAAARPRIQRVVSTPAEVQVIGAALDLEPRLRPSTPRAEAVEQTFAETRRPSVLRQDGEHDRLFTELKEFRFDSAEADIMTMDDIALELLSSDRLESDRRQ